MSDDFKRKLEAYEKGKLSDTELEEFEKDLEKLEAYQEFMEENHPTETTSLAMNEKRAKKILKRSKWRARLQTAFMAIAIFIGFTIVTSILSAVYYSWGTQDRMEVYRSVIDYTMTVTDPYGDMGGTSTNSTPYFGLKTQRDLKKRVGDEVIKVGELKTNFLFSMMSYPEREYFGSLTEQAPVFSYPGSEERGMSGWDRLKNLPEGTVVSAYVSFAELLDTDQVFQNFNGKEMKLLWLAVDTGSEGNDDHGSIFEPFGFPNYPIWHDDDMILDSREEEKGLFGSRVISEGHSSPEYNEGDTEVLHKQFLKTLNFLEDNEKKVNKFLFGKTDLSKQIKYLEKNGFQHYGVVITGPTKEILKLQDEEWISALEVDEVRLWNWDGLK
ncbi:anti-sigma factor [Cytobacillus purgationiresistens]|uniref:Sigma factor regulator n=1 Tax=Cytobacillus purgationiresistens TaxID=863449 RepID=A0ABU0ALA2_9BACI|nr:anti-sigma factor [Cytobacillus purgationiresistens]MDQ0271669.1 hypothetical protein [Cytobacillus purgationiresistens]